MSVTIPKAQSALDRFKSKLSAKPKRSAIDEHFDYAMRWWKKYCWNNWKFDNEELYSNMCESYRNEGLRQVGLEVYKFWENSAWKDDEQDASDLGKEAFCALLGETFKGLDTLAGIQAELDWSALHKAWRVPARIDVSDDNEVY